MAYLPANSRRWTWPYCRHVDEPDMPTDDAQFLAWMEAKANERWAQTVSMLGTLAFERLGRLIDQPVHVNEFVFAEGLQRGYSMRRESVLDAVRIGRDVLARRVAKKLLGV